ncbi:GNAT family N-acetyltransferase [Planctomycetota bacterium]|nr:GNAT family N-acetyltransferase [Planctomycetota bacterium]
MNNDEIQLIQPRLDMEHPFRDYINAFTSDTHIAGLGYLDARVHNIPFISAILQTQQAATGQAGQHDLTPRTTLWLINTQNQILGSIDFRHNLNGTRAVWGGNIGFSVHPNHRRKGYATIMLDHIKQCAKSHKLTRLLITTDLGNIPSANLIKNCGGKYDTTVNVPERNLKVERYWINL